MVFKVIVAQEAKDKNRAHRNDGVISHPPNSAGHGHMIFVLGTFICFSHLKSLGLRRYLRRPYVQDQIQH